MSDFLVRFAGRQHRVCILLFVLAAVSMFCGACADHPKAKDKAEAEKTFQAQQKTLLDECEALERLRNGLERERQFSRLLREQIGAKNAAEYLFVRQEMEEISAIRSAAEEACLEGEARKDNPFWTRLDSLLRGVESEFGTLDQTLRTIVSRVELENN